MAQGRHDTNPLETGTIAMERPSLFLREWGYCHGETNSINWRVVHIVLGRSSSFSRE
jgi:hypothetical protein